MIAHLITDNCLSKPFDESRHYFGILSLVCEPSDGTLCQQFLRYLFDPFECAATTVVSDRRCD